MNVVRLYGKAGYEIKAVIMDMEFEKIKTILPELNISINAAWSMLEKWKDVKGY